MTEDPDTINRRRAEEILAKVKETIPMEPLLVVGEPKPEKETSGFWRGVAKRFF
jgi:hypothetical protein